MLRSAPDDPVVRAGVEIAGLRTVLFVPLHKDNVFLGRIVAARQEVQPFTDKQMALLQNFAAQAVVAMENARLLTETREALEQQTATAEVLQVINSSPGDLAPVFDAMLDKAMHLCEATYGHLVTFDGEFIHIDALTGDTRLVDHFRNLGPVRPPMASVVERMLGGEDVVHIQDTAADAGSRVEGSLLEALADIGGTRSLLGVGLRKDRAFVGAIVVYRQEVRPFTDKQIALLQNFAAQAVIAMENARLLTETREALEQQTATAEVLGVINSSPGDLAPVFDAMLDKAMHLCDAAFGILLVAEADIARTVASRNVPRPFVEFLTQEPLRLDPHTFLARALQEQSVIHVADGAAGEPYKKRAPLAVAAVELGGIRTMLMVPMTKDGKSLGLFTIYRQEVRPFSDKQIALLQNFAAQAVIAIENARLLGELRTARDSAEAALGELKTAQASLIHAEKMASLGQLTAGIAHEIKNPLNFVNNFAGLSVELLDELKETVQPAIMALGDDKRVELDEIVAMLTGNLDKIAEHGRRADGIVKSMLAHSRGGSGEREAVDINLLVDEALNLAYHGARAQDQNFNVTLERDFGGNVAPIELVPQDITRVLLNLVGNGFYATSKRRDEVNQAKLEPRLKVTTRDLGIDVEIRVRDNGVGIPPEVRDKLFQPFFTTKPTGEGTGLGLSISYDIVTQLHGGTIEVDSAVGEYTEFTIRLPRRAAAGARLPTGADGGV